MMSNDNNELPEKGNVEDTTVNGEVEPTEAPPPVTATTDVNDSTHILIGLQDVDYDIDHGDEDSNSDDEFVEAEETSLESSVDTKDLDTIPEEASAEKNDDKESSPEKDDQTTATDKTSPNASNSSDSSKQADKTSSNSTPTDTRRRVKLYMLNQNRTWDDRGTGYVRHTYNKNVPGTALVVKAEADGSILLESKIQPDTAYQKQQDTLIVWSEDENYDLALSFQERVGCEEIWAMICQVQGKDPALDVTQNVMDDEESDLPPCEVERLDEINSVIASSLTLQGKKENISIAIESENYIPKLLELFTELESKKDIVSLQKLFEVIKNIFLLNQNSLLEILVSEECIWDVFGVLEYDPNGAAVRDFGAKKLPNKALFTTIESGDKSDKAEPSSVSMPSEADLVKLIREKRHREFLTNVSKFKDVVPREKKELVSKIHQTYRVQYIQDVILPSPSVFEDNMLSTLSSFIFFNKVEIVNLIQQDRKFLQELFRQLADETPSFSEKRRDLVMFFKELCTFSHTLQLQNRDAFIKTLQHMGLLDTVQLLLNAKDLVIKSGGVDILNYCVDYSPSMVREFCINQTNLRAKTTACLNRTLDIDLKFPDLSREQVDGFLINVMIKQMILDVDPDMGMSSQLAHTLKILLDPENMLNNDSFNVRHLQSSRLEYHNFFSQKSEKMDFLNFFYKYCLGRLVEPMEQVTAVKGKSKENLTQQEEEAIRSRSLAIHQTSQSAQLLSTILDLLTFCVEHHGLHIRSFILMNNILNTVVKLLASRHTFLVLSVIRFIRRIVNLKDEFYYKRIVSANIFGPIFDVFLKNGGRYNLLDSAVIDLFEFIKLSNNQLLINYIIDNFWTDKLEHIDYVKTFKAMKSSADQHKQLREKVELNNILLSSRFRRDRRDLEKEEETWFREDDDDDDDSIEDEDDALDIYVPNDRAPPTLRLTSRIKRQKAENDPTSETSISSIFTSTFKAKPEERKLKINITSKSLGSAEVKCDPLNDNSNEPKIENESDTETISKTESCPQSNELETESIYEDVKVNANVDSTSIMMETDNDSKTCVDSTINENKAATIDESHDECSQEENHILNANTTASKPADTTALTQPKENGSSPLAYLKDDILEFVSSSTFIPQSETLPEKSADSERTLTIELNPIKKVEVSSSSSLKNKRKLDDDLTDDNDGDGVHDSESITTTDPNITKLISRNKRVCLTNPSNEPGELHDEVAGNEKQLNETNISQSD